MPAATRTDAQLLRPTLVLVHLTRPSSMSKLARRAASAVLLSSAEMRSASIRALSSGAGGAGEGTTWPESMRLSLVSSIAFVPPATAAAAWFSSSTHKTAEGSGGRPDEVAGGIRPSCIVSSSGWRPRARAGLSEARHISKMASCEGQGQRAHGGRVNASEGLCRQARCACNVCSRATHCSERKVPCA